MDRHRRADSASARHCAVGRRRRRGNDPGRRREHAGDLRRYLLRGTDAGADGGRGRPSTGGGAAARRTRRGRAGGAERHAASRLEARQVQRWQNVADRGAEHQGEHPGHQHQQLPVGAGAAHQGHDSRAAGGLQHRGRLPGVQLHHPQGAEVVQRRSGHHRGRALHLRRPVRLRGVQHRPAQQPALAGQPPLPDGRGRDPGRILVSHDLRPSLRVLRGRSALLDHRLDHDHAAVQVPEAVSSRLRGPGEDQRHGQGSRPGGLAAASGHQGRDPLAALGTQPPADRGSPLPGMGPDRDHRHPHPGGAQPLLQLGGYRRPAAPLHRSHPEHQGDRRGCGQRQDSVGRDRLRAR